MRVRVDAIGTYMYPDVVVMCGKPEFEDAVVDTLLNPVLVIEVLSPSTERYDRGARFAHYRAIPSLQAYMLVAQDRAWVELYVRQPYDTWNFRACIGRPNQVDIEPLGIRIELSDIYESLDVPDTLPDLIDPSREP